MRLLHGTFEMGQRHDTGKRGSGKIDLPRMAEGGLDCEFFAVFLGQGERTPEKHAMAKAMADSIITAVEDMCSTYPDLVELATTPDDAFRLEKLGKRAAFLGMENGYPIGKDISLIDYFYNRGIRYITLCHSANNEICDSSTDEKNGPEWNGLSPFGEKVVGAMNRLGMIIDVSHLSDSSFYDVIRLSRAPVVASHSCCRALCDHPRNLTDDMLTALAKNGGVIQICFVSSFVKETKPNPRRDAAIKKEREAIREKYGDYDQIEDPKIKEEYRNAYYSLFDKYPQKQATVKDLVNHIDHVVKLIGIDHVGIGTDFDGGGGLDGCNDVSELPNVTIELVRRGYSEEDIRKIWGGNFIRAFREIIEVGRKL
jgi:membrane dipeptidase